MSEGWFNECNTYCPNDEWSENVQWVSRGSLSQQQFTGVDPNGANDNDEKPRRMSTGNAYGTNERVRWRDERRRKRTKQTPLMRRQVDLMPHDFCVNTEPRDNFSSYDVKPTSFFDQCLAVLERISRQALRKKAELALEIFVPLIFILITVILWSLWGTDKIKETNYINYKNLPNGVDPTLYRYFVCSKDNNTPGLAGCLPNVEYDCDGDESTLPYKGICVDKEYARGITGMVGVFVNLYVGYLGIVPPLDTIILHQWLARKSRRKNGGANGLLPNTRLSSIQCSGSLYFVGDAGIVGGLVSHMNATSNYFKHVYGGTFATMDKANEVLAKNALNWGVVQITHFESGALDVTIHLNSSALPKLNAAVPLAFPGGFQFDRAEMYVISGYLTLQKLISDYFMTTFYPTADLQLTAYVASLAFPAYSQTPLLMYARDLLPLIYTLAFLYSVSIRTKRIVLEKETRLREAMLIMGMRDSVLYVSWLVMSVAVDIVVCVAMCIILKLTYVTRSNPFLLFLFFFVFSLTTIPLAGLLAAFFSKARLASLLSPIIYFILTVPNFATAGAEGAVVTVFSLLSPSAFTALMERLLSVETSRGFGPGDMNNKAYNPTAMVIFAMMVVDFFLYYLLMLYFDAVLPKDWGTPKHPLFFILDVYNSLSGKEAMYEGGLDGREMDGVFEDSDDEMENAVVVCGLRKEFAHGGHNFTAVDSLYWNMKVSDISVLLGHNGAGKSTTLNMMTGMLEPDEGDCYVYGTSVRRELSKVRQQIGFCPQHNILWPELTCREHLEFFGKIKGFKGAELEEAVQRMLTETDLMEKMDYAAKALSGGQKRKLSVSIAFVGQSRLVFLDEPTAGMDVGARRYTWELLRRMSEHHTILLTTHYMDEADLLGHRIGIMSQGRLQCSGSSMFLKSHLGLGYSLTIAMHPAGNYALVKYLVCECVPGAEMIGYNGGEISFRLPQSEAASFPRMLEAIETNENTGVRGYTLSATTLEEVFLRVSNALSDNSETQEDYSLLWNCRCTDSPGMCQFRAMLKKRWLNAVRDRRMQCFQIVCPVLCVLVAMLLGLIRYSDGRALSLNFDMYAGESLVDLAQCQYLWKPNTSVRSVVLNETHLPNAEELGDYAIDTYYSHTIPRYASVSCIDRDLFAVTGARNPVIMMYNSSSPHQIAVSMWMVYQLILENIAGIGNISWGVGLMPESVTLPGSPITQIMSGAIIMIPFTFLPSNPVAWVVKERECGALHLQRICGLRFTIYWLTNFIFDFAAYVVSTLLVVTIFAIFQRKEYVGSDTVGTLFLLFVVYGLCSTAAAYVISFAFNEHSTAQTVVMAVSFVTGFLLVMVVFVLSLLEKTRTTSNNLRWPFRLIPTYCIGEALINLRNLDQLKNSGQAKSALDGDVAGWAILYLACEFPVFVLLLLFIDHPRRRSWSERRQYSENSVPDSNDFLHKEDSDVEDEREAVYESFENDDDDGVLTVLNLRKEFPNGKVAVRNVTFSIMPGEVFGFLGTNGAGKTTTMSILSQQFLPSSGIATVCGYDVVYDAKSALTCIGYCPQFDGTLDLLTVEEHLHLYCSVRGIKGDQQGEIVECLLSLCGITRYRSTLSSELSGGNRRKLSVAMSLVGGPCVVFLDEPSAGMDPVARRALWTTIQIAATYCSVVLTTHHLEEVEALADVVAIMVDGRLHCIGDKVHLKNKFGSGYEMSLRIASPDLRASVEHFVADIFPGAVLNEFKGQRFVYALPKDASLSEAFRILQEYKVAIGITDYSVSQTSIEQVFLRISEGSKR